MNFPSYQTPYLRGLVERITQISKKNSKKLHFFTEIFAYIKKK